MISRSLHATYERVLQDTPIRCKQTYLHANVYKYNCENPDVEEIGVDDVAIRKGQTYATAVYDLKDHHLIALFEGRDAKTLKQWLKSHQKIKLVARDRASAYAAAIKEVLPECIQMAGNQPYLF